MPIHEGDGRPSASSSGLLAVVLDEPRRGGGVLSPLPRPRGLGVVWEGAASPPRKQEEVFRANLSRVLARFPAWVLLALRWLWVLLRTWVSERDPEERRLLRARSLRELLQTAGPTAIKFGQQVSLRIDLIPYAYANELEQLLDKIPAFPIEDAVRRIERSVGKKLDEVFSAFDPEPIGSASIACVYQALRRNGRKVAVKVRRPGIGRRLAADLRALRWVLWWLELFYLPPGFTRNLLFELETMLTEELDFVREARYTDLFRRETKRAKQRYVTTPKVHFDLSSKKVLVEDYVSGGYWLGEIIKAVENRNEKALAELERLKIKPKVIAHRLLRVNRFGGFEALFFHADLHPANVKVLPGNKLVLIDFGSVGAFTRDDLNSWRRLLYAQSVKDVGAMVKAALALIEPLPPMEIEDFTRQLEAIFFQDLYAIESKHSEWWERTSANIWIEFFKLARDFHVSVNLNTLKQIRGTMLVDTVAARLYRDVDHYREFRRYERQAGRRAAKRLAKRIRKDFFGPRFFVLADQAYDLANTAFYRVQRLLQVNDPRLMFARLIRKGSLAAVIGVSTAVRLGLLVVGATLAAWAAVRLEWLTIEGVNPDAWPWPSPAVLWQILKGLPGLWWLGLPIILVFGRRLLYRLNQVDIER